MVRVIDYRYNPKGEKKELKDAYVRLLLSRGKKLEYINVEEVEVVEDVEEVVEKAAPKRRTRKKTTETK